LIRAIKKRRLRCHPGKRPSARFILLSVVANILSDGSFRFDYVPGPGTFTMKTSHAQDATTTSTKQVLASTIAEQKVLHSYGAATTTVQLTDSDLDAINLVVPEQPAASQP